MYLEALNTSLIVLFNCLVEFISVDYIGLRKKTLDWLAQTTNSSAVTQINKVLCLNKR